MCQMQLDVEQYTLSAVALCPQEAIFNILLELFDVAAVINCKTAELYITLHVSNHLSCGKENLHLNQHLCFSVVNVSLVNKKYKMIQNCTHNTQTILCL